MTEGWVSSDSVIISSDVPRIKALKDAGDDPQKVGIMVASHNADTVRYGVNRWVRGSW